MSEVTQTVIVIFIVIVAASYILIQISDFITDHRKQMREKDCSNCSIKEKEKELK